jgi:hypothetical protein
MEELTLFECPAVRMAVMVPDTDARGVALEHFVVGATILFTGTYARCT